MNANAIDKLGRRITLAQDGGVWVGEDFYPRGKRVPVAFPLRPVDPEDPASEEECEILATALSRPESPA